MDLRRPRRVAAAAALLLGLALPQQAVADFGFIRSFGSENLPQSDPNYLFNPYGITVAGGPDRTVYTIMQNGRITSFSPEGLGAKVIVSESSSGPEHAPGHGIAECGSKLYVADTTNNRVVVLSTSGGFLDEFGTVGFGNGQLNFPSGIALDEACGQIFVADQRNHRVAVFTTAGDFVKNIGKNNGDGSNGTGNGEFTYPAGVAVRGGSLFVSEEGYPGFPGGHRVQKLTIAGGFVTKWGSPGSADGQFNFPDDLAIDALGNSWVIEPAPNARVQVFDPNGQFLTKIKETSEHYFSGHGIAIDKEGYVYVLDGENGRVLVYGERGSQPGGTPCPPAASSFAGPLVRAPLARSAAPVNEVKVVRLKGAAEYKPAGCREWAVLREGTTLKEGDEINVDPDGEVVLEFGDNSKVTIQETTQLKIASFFTEGGVVRTELLLKVGQVSAKVIKTETTRSDFRIKAPSATSSIRGTVYSHFHDRSGASLVSVRQGVVAVKGKRGKAKKVPARREVEVTGRGVGKIAKLGRAGAPKGGLNRGGAMKRVNALLGRAQERCGFDVPAYSLKRTRKGWNVSVKLTGATKGKAGFKVVRKKASPGNKLGRRVARRCR